MFFAKAKVVVAAVLVVAALAVGGVAYRADAPAGQGAPVSPAKPRSELEALRHQNELLKLNLEVVLEKVRAQEAELRDLREKRQAAETRAKPNEYRATVTLVQALRQAQQDPTSQAEAALKALRQAKDDEARRHAVEALERALGKLRAQLAADPTKPLPQAK
jgi:hypothetical protein